MGNKTILNPPFHLMYETSLPARHSRKAISVDIAQNAKNISGEKASRILYGQAPALEAANITLHRQYGENK